MRIGIFGGSFNPIHNGHLTLADNLLTAAGLDEIWMVVSPQNPFKRQDGLMADSLRMQLVRKALENAPRLKACDYEMHRPKPSYMWDTLQGLSRDWPQHTFTLIIGSDNWARFGEWYHADDIVSSCPIVIYPRPGFPVGRKELPGNVILADMPQMDISSTEIRRRMQAGEDISGLVPEAVAELLASASVKPYPQN